ncbi:interferon alpha/beta receptor 1-like isoform 9-T20 [Syngnathus typhle]
MKIINPLPLLTQRRMTASQKGRVIFTNVHFCGAAYLEEATSSRKYKTEMASAVLSPPRNVRLTSMNMNLVLRWDSPEGLTGDISYTTECNTSVRICHVGCVNISTLECDFSSLNTFLSVYGRYKARVRAQRGENHSSWVESKPITLESDNLRSVYGTATYNITYWKDGQNEKAKHISSVLQNQIFLNDLDPGTKYCVQVQIIAESNTKPSNPSSTVCESTTNVSEHLPPPQKVDFITLNTNYTLKWEWNRATSKSQAVSFSVQYMSKYKLESKKRYYWSNACDKTFSKSCDLTAHNLHYLGFYMLRVRTNDNSSHSEWVQKEFCPEKHAAIGPPSKVELAVAVNNIDVFISDPLTSSNRSMRQNLKKLHYYIVYWEHNVDKQVLQPQIIHTSAQMVTLPDLNYWTLYCVRVQSCSDHPDKRSKFNLPYCIQTDGHTPWWQTVMYFLGSLLMACTVVLLVLYILFRCYSIFKATFYPLIQLPSFFHKKSKHGHPKLYQSTIKHSWTSWTEVYKDRANSWVAPLPFCKPQRHLPNNRGMALRRLLPLRRTRDKRTDMKERFLVFMKKVFENNQAELPPELEEHQERLYTLFKVYHPQKPNQIRVVFDSSAKHEGVTE